MFNMYLSGSSLCPVKNHRKSYNSLNCGGCRCPRGGDAPSPGQSIVQPFQSESPSALLSEIGNPFSWTRFLASRRGDRKGDMLLALDCDWTRIQLGFKFFNFR